MGGSGGAPVAPVRIPSATPCAGFPLRPSLRRRRRRRAAQGVRWEGVGQRLRREGGPSSLKGHTSHGALGVTAASPGTPYVVKCFLLLLLLLWLCVDAKRKHVYFTIKRALP